jgi:hypothetical protein
MKKSNKKFIASEEFDKKFDSGEDVTGHLDLAKAKVNRHVRRINIDFPESFLEKIDAEAEKIGVARTALIKMWLSDHLKHARA